MEAQQQSKGRFLAATDEEILAAYHLVARTEGVFVEPASAASVAGPAEVGRGRLGASAARPWCARSPATGSRIPTPR